ncbi:MAG: hypothetical protein HOM11_01430 [Methylococcales bacterium]|nr:hypothetical protein [Methylococcales bacterium]MBT7444565.1 hypothetical protein [Methylococcales bacterium]
MQFLAHFIMEENESIKASFSMLVAANDINLAVDKFKLKILETEKSEAFFGKDTKIFLEAIIQINEFPEEASITMYESVQQSGQSRLSITPVDGVSLEAYEWTPDDNNVINLDRTETIYPFVTL